MSNFEIGEPKSNINCWNEIGRLGVILHMLHIDNRER